MVTYQEKEQLVKFLFDKRNRILALSPYQVNDSDRRKSDELFDRINYAYRHCEDEHRKILENEFILHMNKDWWYDYYSRSTYYRMKQRAMDEFLHCLE